MAGSLIRAVRGAVLAVHRRLLPESPRIGWTPYLWLFWLSSFAFKWFFVPLEPVEIALALLTVLPFPMALLRRLLALRPAHLRQHRRHSAHRADLDAVQRRRDHLFHLRGRVHRKGGPAAAGLCLPRGYRGAGRGRVAGAGPVQLRPALRRRDHGGDRHRDHPFRRTRPAGRGAATLAGRSQAARCRRGA